MEQILEKVMNFINENTMLLIIICIFLIVILVIYLIDNTIKTKRLEKMEAEKKENPEEPAIIDNPIPEKVEEPVVPVIEEPTNEDIIPEDTETPIEETPAPVVEEPIVEETPVVDSSIDDLLNKDYSANNEVVNNMPEEPVVEAPKSKYKNDKKLSDILGKKKETVETKKIETTQDFSDELDRILQKLNSEESTNEDESTDYTNMF